MMCECGHSDEYHLKGKWRCMRIVCKCKKFKEKNER